MSWLWRRSCRALFYVLLVTAGFLVGIIWNGTARAKVPVPDFTQDFTEYVKIVYYHDQTTKIRIDCPNIKRFVIKYRSKEEAVHVYIGNTRGGESCPTDKKIPESVP